MKIYKYIVYFNIKKNKHNNIMKKFSLFENIEKNLKTINEIDNAIKITLGPTGKNGIVSNKKNELKFITTGAFLLKSLEFPDSSSNVILKLLEQAAVKTTSISGDGSTTTVLLSCELLKNSLKFVNNGYSSLFLNNGFKKLAHFVVEKVTEFSIPITNQNHLLGVLKTSIGKKMNSDLFNCVQTSLKQISRDGLILVEENIKNENEIEIVEGIELDKGFASSYFVNDLNSFSTIYENPYILITNQPITSLNQIRDVIEYIKLNNKPLVLVAEEISKEIISTLVLNSIQKKIKVVVVKYTSIKFIKNGLLEDLSLLTHSNYYVPTVKKEEIKNLTVDDLGQCDKVIIKKEKSTFILSKFSKILAKRRINELNRELLSSESEYEKSLFKTRIARLSGNITKIKIGTSNQYEIIEQRQKVENAIITLKSALEEGILPGGGAFYLYLREEISNWSSLNLIGEEIFAANILMDSLKRPFEELFNNINLQSYKILEEILIKGYPYTYDVLNKKISNSFTEGIVDSAKSIRSILWNSITIISTIITSE
jgi:chaperonin GroEL